MAYIDSSYYASFGGRTVDTSEFTRLAEIASDVVYDICRIKPSTTQSTSADFKKAVAYELEFLSEQGGIDSILGFSEAALSGSSERLGDYSVTEGSGSKAVLTTSDGIPVSPMTVMLLRKMGLMTKWAYTQFYQSGGA